MPFTWKGLPKCSFSKPLLALVASPVDIAPCNCAMGAWNMTNSWTISPSPDLKLQKGWADLHAQGCPSGICSTQHIHWVNASSEHLSYWVSWMMFLDRDVSLSPHHYHITPQNQHLFHNPRLLWTQILALIKELSKGLQEILAVWEKRCLTWGNIQRKEETTIILTTSSTHPLFHLLTTKL